MPIKVCLMCRGCDLNKGVNQACSSPRACIPAERTRKLCISSLLYLRLLNGIVFHYKITRPFFVQYEDETVWST